jgi:membrane protease subunit (stomatin/prohibitin family)
MLAPSHRRWHVEMSQDGQPLSSCSPVMTLAIDVQWRQQGLTTKVFQIVSFELAGFCKNDSKSNANAFGF